MKRIALASIAIISIFAFICQLYLINTQTPAFAEPKILSLAFTSEFILLFTTAIFLSKLFNKNHKIAELQAENDMYARDYDSLKVIAEDLFTHTNTAIAILDLDGRVKKANHAFYQLLGYSNGTEGTVLNYFSILDARDLSDLQPRIQELIDGTMHVYRGEQQCFKKSDEMVWANATLSLLRNKANTPTQFIVQLENITLQKKAEERLQHMAYHDPLTGLANRNKLEQFINHVIATSRRQQTGFALMFIDLDRFKNINDTVGHAAGDMLLQIVSERLHGAVRNSDMVARLGGDEFILLVTDVKKAESVAIIAQKILDDVMRVICINQQALYVTTSIGISLYPSDGQNMEMLMKHADLALYRAKEKGRNNYEFYTSEMTIHAQEKLALQNAIGHACEKGEFLLHYQPKMDMQTRQITGVEALLRWKNKEYSAITPDEIISLAEETGMIVPVSQWIIENACQQLKQWHNQGMTSLTMAVNCSPRQFKHASFIDDVLTVLSKTGLSPRSLELEITEKMIMDDPENMLRILFAIKDIGVQIVIDDFGTGYWSLNNLRRLSIDKIKIDKTFIKHISEDINSAAITSAILAMAKKIGCKSIAEGVETVQQYTYLDKEGCTEVQGYYLTKPLPEELMTHFLKHPIPDAESISKSVLS